MNVLEAIDKDYQNRAVKPRHLGWGYKALNVL